MPIQRSDPTPRNESGGIPQVLGVQASHVRYPRPKLRYRGMEVVPFSESVEILVRTSGPFPIQAYSPAIFIGETPIIEFEPAEPNVYRFLAFDFRDLVQGAPISIGWPQHAAAKVQTPFRFRLGPPTVA